MILSHLLTGTGFLKERLLNRFCILCILAFISVQLCLYSVCLVLFRIPEPPPLNRKKPYRGPGSCGETDYRPGNCVDVGFDKTKSNFTDVQSA